MEIMPYATLMSQMSLTSGALSGNTPNRSNDIMDLGTVLNVSTPNVVSSNKLLKRTANRKMNISSKASVKVTVRKATAIPLMRIISSGVARSKRTMRAMRVSLTMRKSFMTLGSTQPEEKKVTCMPVTQSTKVKMPASRIIVSTKMESNMNQPSPKQARFSLKAMNRMKISTKKYKKKKYSATMKTQCALRINFSLFKSRSTAIQIALKQITPRVKVSKTCDLAIHCHTPSSWYKVFTSYSCFITASRTLAFILSRSANTAPFRFRLEPVPGSAVTISSESWLLDRWVFSLMFPDRPALDSVSDLSLSRIRSGFLE
mmetsp:Transcript_79502/g.184495  ORF Transcript_79502/g.184495 Transcript_79502/m.184495 type:complete len:316 (-) Transcript_79502:734-1681(-)